MPKISVVMPIYNAEKYLVEAIESILIQTYEDFEFLIINDGSTDKSTEIINGYADKRIKLVHNEKNMGVAKSLNKGIELSKGEYIARMDADDISVPERFYEQIFYLDANKDIAVCGTWIEYFGKKSFVLQDPVDPKEIKCYLLFNSVVKHPSVMMKKKLLNKNYGYNEKINRAEDYDLWVRISQRHNIANIGKVLLKYRIHDTTISRVHIKENKAQAMMIRINQIVNLDLFPSIDEIILHENLSNRFGLFPHEQIDSAKKWLTRIYDANKKKKIYDEKALLNVIKTKMQFINENNTDKKKEIINQNRIKQDRIETSRVDYPKIIKKLIKIFTR